LLSPTALPTYPAAHKKVTTRARIERAPDLGISRGIGLTLARSQIDLDAALIAAHSDKQGAAPSYKKGSGFIRRCRSFDHGDGAGRPWAGSSDRATPPPTPPPITWPRCSVTLNAL